jgi:RHS repeat-associated protein
MDKIYDRSDNVIADWQATGQMQGGWSVGYLYLMGRLGALFENSTTYFVGTDHLGSTRGLVDTSGNIIDAYHYLPFGELLQGSTYTGHKFTGFERDSETGLDNARARYHASWMGRFLSLDPHNAGAIATSPQTWNAYVYVSNNPLTLTDPTGMIVSGDGDTNPNAGDGNTIFGDGHQNEPHVATEDGNQATGQQNPSPTAQNQQQHYDATKSGPEDPTNPGKPLAQNPIVQKASDGAFESTDNGRARGGLAEAGFSIEYKDGKISIANQTDSVHDSGPANELHIKTDANTIAVLHTHGNNAVPTPSMPTKNSPGDVASRVPNFVRSQSSLYVTVPGTTSYIQLTPVPPK